MPDLDKPTFAEMLVAGDVEQTDIERFIETWRQEMHLNELWEFLGLTFDQWMGYVNHHEEPHYDMRKVLEHGIAAQDR